MKLPILYHNLQIPVSVILIYTRIVDNIHNTAITLFLHEQIPIRKNHAIHGCSPVIYKAYAHHVPVAPHNSGAAYKQSLLGKLGLFISLPIWFQQLQFLYERLCYVFTPWV